MFDGKKSKMLTKKEWIDECHKYGVCWKCLQLESRCICCKQSENCYDEPVGSETTKSTTLHSTRKNDILSKFSQVIRSLW